MVDTCSTRSFIRRDVAKGLDLEVDQTRQRTVFLMDDTGVRTQGETMVRVTLMESTEWGDLRTIRLQLQVVDTLPAPILLGTDFLVAAKPTLDYGTLQMSFKGENEESLENTAEPAESHRGPGGPINDPHAPCSTVEGEIPSEQRRLGVVPQNRHLR